MNKAQIKAELRRSALEDERPMCDVALDAFRQMMDFIQDGESMSYWSNFRARIFFLLVAEAL